MLGSRTPAHFVKSFHYVRVIMIVAVEFPASFYAFLEFPHEAFGGM